MMNDDIRDILKRVGRNNEDIRLASIKQLRRTILMIGDLNGPYRSRKFLKNLLAKPFNLLNKRQFQINECIRHSLRLIEAEIKINFDDSLKSKHPEGTPRLVVFVPFDFRLADFGGAARTYHLYNSLSESFVVDAVAISPEPSARRCTKAYNNNFTVHVVPHSKEYADLRDSEQSKAGGRLHDILLIDHYRLIPELVDLCRRLSYRADFAIACHPFVFNMLADICRDTILIYEAHDIESDLKRSYFSEANEASRAYIHKVRAIEEKACRESELIFTVSREDADYIHREFGVDTGKIAIVENGVDARRSAFIDPAERRALRRDLGIDEPLVVFVGSDHAPNTEAVDFIIEELAPRDENIMYLIGGSISQHYASREEKGELPKNVLMLGILPEKEKEALYSIGDIAINPMFSGSGTNLKIFDYGAHGLPIVSTSFGMRGAPDLEGCVTLRDRDTFFDGIRELMRETGTATHSRKVEECRKIIREKYDWEVIAGRMARAITHLCANKKQYM